MGIQQATRANQDWHDDLLDTWREHIEQARRGQEVGLNLARESAAAYEDFLDSLFSYYGESMRAAERAAGKGSRQRGGVSGYDHACRE